MKPTTGYLLTLAALVLLTVSVGCSRYAEMPNEEITISNEDLLQLKEIQKDISKNVEAITDSNGYFSDRFYFDTDRLNRKLNCIDAGNLNLLYSLYRKGTIRSLRIIDKECCAYFLKFKEAGAFDKYADEAWLIYHGQDTTCGKSYQAHEHTVWEKAIDENWTLIKNKRVQYHKF